MGPRERIMLSTSEMYSTEIYVGLIAVLMMKAGRRVLPLLIIGKNEPFCRNHGMIQRSLTFPCICSQL